MPQLNVRSAALAAETAGYVLGNSRSIDKVNEVPAALNLPLEPKKYNGHFKVNAGGNGPFLPFNTREADGLFGGTKFTDGRPLGLVAEGRGTQAGNLLLSFRGSTRLGDALIDCSTGIWQSSKGFAAHSGFVAAFNSMKYDLDQLVPRTLAPTELHIAGHSMGGALATLAAEYLAGRGHRIYLYTFGSPRVGTKEFCDNLIWELGEQNIKRYYYDGDFVTWLPAWPFCHLPGTRLITGHRVGRHTDYFKPQHQTIAPQERHTWSDARDQAFALLSGQGGVASAKYLCKRGAAVLGKVLMLILKLVGGLIGLTVTAAATVIDLVIYALYQGVRLGGWMLSLIDKFYRYARKWCGMPEDRADALKGPYGKLKILLRAILDRMFSVVKSDALRELERWRQAERRA